MSLKHFWDGFFNTMSFGRTINKCDWTPSRSDKEALESDWENVGKDTQESFTQFKKNDID